MWQRQYYYFNGINVTARSRESAEPNTKASRNESDHRRIPAECRNTGAALT